MPHLHSGRTQILAPRVVQLLVFQNWNLVLRCFAGANSTHPILVRVASVELTKLNLTLKPQTRVIPSQQGTKKETRNAWKGNIGQKVRKSQSDKLPRWRAQCGWPICKGGFQGQQNSARSWTNRLQKSEHCQAVGCCVTNQERWSWQVRGIPSLPEGSLHLWKRRTCRGSETF